MPHSQQRVALGHLLVAAFALTLASCASQQLEIGNASEVNEQTAKLEAEQERLLQDVRQKLASLAPLPTESVGEPEVISAERVRRERMYQVLRNIERQIADQKRTAYISPPASTPFEPYYDRFCQKVESGAINNFPTQDGKPVYGRVVLNIKLSFEGRIEEIEIVRSPSEVLSQHSIRLLRSLEPFEPFPEEVRKVSDRIVITTPMNYTHIER